MSDKDNSVLRLYVYLKPSQTTEELIRKSVESFVSQTGTAFDTNSVNILKTAKGKPYLVGTDSIYLSVTHSGDFCIIAVSFFETGIDLQFHERLKTETEQQAAERYLKLSKRYFHNDEYEYVKTDPLVCFFDVWTAKESYVKYKGNGIDDSFGTYSVLPENNQARTLSWKKSDAYFRIVPFVEGYTLCTCSSEQTSVKLIYN